MMSRSRQAGGSGLGLAITKKLIEAHGGTVTAQSRAGAVFTIRLPAGPAPLFTPAGVPAPGSDRRSAR